MKEGRPEERPGEADAPSVPAGLAELREWARNRELRGGRCDGLRLGDVVGSLETAEERAYAQWVAGQSELVGPDCALAASFLLEPDRTDLALLCAELAAAEDVS